MRYFVYRYKDENDKIVYIGKTSQQYVTERISQHVNDPIGKWANNNKHFIDFIEVSREEDMNYIESYLIRKELPTFNTIFLDKNNPPPFELVIPNSVWIKIEDIKKYEASRKQKTQKIVHETISENLSHYLNKYSNS